MGYRLKSLLFVVTVVGKTIGVIGHLTVFALHPANGANGWIGMTADLAATAFRTLHGAPQFLNHAAMRPTQATAAT
jgi:hypothetical protein